MQVAHLGISHRFWHHVRMGHLRPPRRLTPADLKGAALDYLDRFAATRARLRQVMLRKIRNSVRAHGDDPAPMLAALTERCVKAFRPEVFVNHYGSTEIYTFSIHRDQRKKPGCAVFCQSRSR